MATYLGNNFKTVPISASGRDDTVTVKSFYTHPETSTKLTDGDIVKLVTIPKGHIITSLTLFANQLDSATALVFKAGTMDLTDTAVDLDFATSLTTAQAGGVVAAPALVTMFTVSGAATVDRILAIEVTTTATGAHSAPGAIGCVVTYVSE